MKVKRNRKDRLCKFPRRLLNKSSATDDGVGRRDGQRSQQENARILQTSIKEIRGTNCRMKANSRKRWWCSGWPVIFLFQEIGSWTYVIFTDESGQCRNIRFSDVKLDYLGAIMQNWYFYLLFRCGHFWQKNSLIRLACKTIHKFRFQSCFKSPLLKLR